MSLKQIRNAEYAMCWDRYLTLFFCLITAFPLRAAEVSSVDIGFHRTGQVGAWLPARVAASGLPGKSNVQLRVTSVDPRGNECAEYGGPGITDAGGSVELSAYFRVGRLEGVLFLDVVSQSDPNVVLCREAVRHEELTSSNADKREVLKLTRHNTVFVLSVGEPAGVAEMVRDVNVRGNMHIAGITLDSNAMLPTSAFGYDTFDVVILAGRFDLSTPQAESLHEWIRSGGHLLITSGANVQSLLDSKLGSFVEQRFELQPKTLPVRDLSALQSFVPGARRLETNRETVPMAVVQSADARTVVDSVAGPIVVRRGIGAGIVTLVTVDLARKPLSDWNSLPELYENLLLGRHTGKRSAATGSRISNSGVSDVSTQWMACIDAQPSRGRWSTWSIMALVVAFMVIIGPVDYFVAVKLMRRPHLTWITFPLLIAAGTAGVIELSGRAEDTDQLHQVEIVDVLQDDDDHRVHVRSWMSLSSATTKRSQLKASSVLQLPDVNASHPLLSWSGRAEDVYGGMYRTGGIGLGTQSYEHRLDSQKADQLTGVPLIVDGSTELLAEWTGRSSVAIVDSRLTVSGFGLLQGTFSHSLPGTVHDWIVVHGNRVYRPTSDNSTTRMIPRQATWDPQSKGVMASDLKGYLTGSRIVRAKQGAALRHSGSQVVTPYDSENRDPVYLATIISLYENTGGEDYVGLSHDLLRRMEVSDSIGMNYALLIGRLESTATELSVDNVPIAPRHVTTIVRAMIAVNPGPQRMRSQNNEATTKTQEENVD